VNVVHKLSLKWLNLFRCSQGRTRILGYRGWAKLKRRLLGGKRINFRGSKYENLYNFGGTFKILVGRL